MKIRGEGASLNGFLDQGSQVEGELAFEETFRIDGKFEGKIRSGSELILGDSSEVSAEIHVAKVSVNGTLRGSVHASERIEILPKARVFADLETPILRIEEGACFQGSCKMREDPREKVVDLSPGLRKERK